VETPIFDFVFWKNFETKLFDVNNKFDNSQHLKVSPVFILSIHFDSSPTTFHKSGQEYLMRYNKIPTPERYLFCKFVSMMSSYFSGQKKLILVFRKFCKSFCSSLHLQTLLSNYWSDEVEVLIIVLILRFQSINSLNNLLDYSKVSDWIHFCSTRKSTQLFPQTSLSPGNYQHKF
jgi:hypothetical protein